MNETVLDEMVAKVMVERHTVIEERIRILLRPQPRWVPSRLYLWLVSKLIVIETQRRA